MKRSDNVPDYLIDGIVRHVIALISHDKNTNKYLNAERLLKKEIVKLQTYKKINK